jgi:hypothetical protein
LYVRSQLFGTNVFSDSEEMIRIAYRWWFMESRSSIRQVQGFTGHSVRLDHNVTPDIKDHFSRTEYSKLFLA